MRGLWAALGLLSILPVPASSRRAPRPHDAGWYPAAGAVVGLAPALALTVARHHPLLAAGLALAAAWTVTGFFHLDGLCDVADAALPPISPERRTEVRRDPRIGAYALGAALSVAAVKFGAYASGVTPLAAWSAAVVARTWVVIPVARAQRYEGSTLGAVPAAPRAVIAVALLSGTAALGGALLASPLRADQAMAMSAAAGIATFGAGVFLRRRLGGLGGDAFGAIIELAEAAALAAYVMTAR